MDRAEALCREIERLEKVAIRWRGLILDNDGGHNAMTGMVCNAIDDALADATFDLRRELWEIESYRTMREEQGNRAWHNARLV